MKKVIFTIMTAAALLFCSCEKDPNPSGNGNGNNTEERTPDITPYLGK